jgi:hypothetical protein
MALVHKETHRPMDPEINSHIHRNLIFDKGAKNILGKKKTQTLQKMVLRKLYTHL